MHSVVVARAVLVVGCLAAAAREGHSSCEVSSFFAHRGSTPVVYGVVEARRDPENGNRSLDLRVLRVLQGHEVRPTVRLWWVGSASAFVDRFPVGRKLVVALTGDGAAAGLPEGSHQLEPRCGTNVLRVRESEDQPGMYLTAIERRLAGAP